MFVALYARSIRLDRAAREAIDSPLNVAIAWHGPSPSWLRIRPSHWRAPASGPPPGMAYWRLSSGGSVKTGAPSDVKPGKYPAEVVDGSLIVCFG